MSAHGSIVGDNDKEVDFDPNSTNRVMLNMNSNVIDQRREGLPPPPQNNQAPIVHRIPAPRKHTMKEMSQQWLSNNLVYPIGTG